MTSRRPSSSPSGTPAGRLERAQARIPGGVNSPVRAFGSVGGEPVFIRRAEGAFLYDADGREYIDLVGSWGPAILGHAHPRVVEAVRKAALDGLSFGAVTEAETVMAETLCRRMPSLEKVRLVCSGTEATMSALRLARAFTSRAKCIKFRGCYHGHADSFLIEAGSGALTFGRPSSPGVTPGAAMDTLLADFNALDSVEALFRAFPDEVACVVVEPVPGNMGVVPPAEGFLPGLRALCDREGALLFFDEVMTGFRVHAGGAQARYGVRPDLTALGKVAGGGLPLAAYGGRAEIMDLLSPKGPVYQAGTLSGNPLAVAAGLATLEGTEEAGFYEELEKKSQGIAEAFSAALFAKGLPFALNRVGSMATVFFAEKEVRDFESALSSDAALFGRFFHALLREGVYLPPSQFEAFFISIAHDEKVRHRLQESLEKALRSW